MTPTRQDDRDSLRSRSPEEMRARSEARRRGLPILVLREPDGFQRIVCLDSPAGKLTIGRREDNDIAVPWDPNTSRLHAELQLLGGEWVIIDDGLSRNGSFVNGRRLTRRRRLRDGDLISVGLTALLYRAPLEAIASTAASDQLPAVPRLTDVQRGVLTALCRPCRDLEERRPPATNLQIAGELTLSVDAVKTHLRVLFAKFHVEQLPRNEKRVQLAIEAMRRGAVVPDNLEVPESG